MATHLDILAPSHLLALWQSEGLSPQEVRARSDTWIAEHLQYATRPLPNGFKKVVGVSIIVKQYKRRGRPPRSPASNPGLDLRTCKRCLATYTIREGFRGPKSKLCNFCKEANEQKKSKSAKQIRIESIGLDILRQDCQKLGVVATDKKYHFSYGTMRRLFPDTHIQRKLPDDATLIELAQNHTLKEIAKMHGCSLERVRQRLKPLGVRAASPTELRIKRAGGLETLYQEALIDGVVEVAKRHHISHEHLRRLLPKVPRKPFPDEKRKIPSPERLQELYSTHTAKEIAEICGGTWRSVFQAIHRAGITKRNPTGNREWTRQELLEFARGLGQPTIMPKVREFREHGKEKLLNRIGYLGGLQVLATETGLSMDGRRDLPAVEVLLEMLETQSIGEVAEELGVSKTGVYGKMWRNKIRKEPKDGKQ